MMTNDQQLLIERYQMVREANLFNKEPLLRTIENYITHYRVTDPHIADWFRTQYVRWFISPANTERTSNIRKHAYSPGEPEWAKKDDIYDFESLDGDEFDHIVDYFSQLSPLDRSKINKETYQVVKAKMAEWDMKLAMNMAATANRGKEGQDYEVVMRFPDGFTMVELKSQQSYKCEGDEMGHCVGGYHGRVGTKIYSLRDPKGGAHATLECQFGGRATGGTIVQIKGKQNAAPKEKYWPYIQKFIEDGKFIVEGDGENIGMILWDWNANSDDGRTDDVYYFEDSDEWRDIYKNYVIPAQEKRIREIDHMIRSRERWSSESEGIKINLAHLLLTELPNYENVEGVRAFVCQGNRLKNLKGAPKRLVGERRFDCSSNKLESLIGSPEVVNSFTCNYNKLSSLADGPKMVMGTLFCNDNQITTLKGMPKRVYGNILAENNLISSLDGLNDIEKVHKNIYLEGNPIDLGPDGEAKHPKVDGSIYSEVKI